METVNIKKSDLLAVLKKNREEHRDLFLKAQKGYRKEAITLLDNALKDAREGRKINMFFRLTAPIDQTKDYDRAIKMIEMSVDEVIPISEKNFAQFVLDDWHWKEHVMKTNLYYLKEGI